MPLDAGQVEVEQDEIPLGQAAGLERVERPLAVGEDVQLGVRQALAERDPHQLRAALGVFDQQDSPRAVMRGQGFLRVRSRASTLREIGRG